MGWPQRLFKDREGTLIQRLSLGVGAGNFIPSRQVIEGRCYLWVVRPQRLLPDRQGALLQRLSLGVLPSGLIQFR